MDSAEFPDLSLETKTLIPERGDSDDENALKSSWERIGTTGARVRCYWTDSTEMPMLSGLENGESYALTRVKRPPEAPIQDTPTARQGDVVYSCTRSHGLLRHNLTTGEYENAPHIRCRGVAVDVDESLIVVPMDDVAAGYWWYENFEAAIRGEATLVPLSHCYPSGLALRRGLVATWSERSFHVYRISDGARIYRKRWDLLNAPAGSLTEDGEVVLLVPQEDSSHQAMYMRRSGALVQPDDWFQIVPESGREWGSGWSCAESLGL